VAYPDETVRRVIYPVAGEAILRRPAGSFGWRRVRRGAETAAGVRAHLVRHRAGQRHHRWGADHHPTQGWISVPSMDKVPEPPSLDALKAEVQRRWGTIDLLSRRPTS
jgi:hypothetical protein